MLWVTGNSGDSWASGSRAPAVQLRALRPGWARQWALQLSITEQLPAPAGSQLPRPRAQGGRWLPPTVAAVWRAWAGAGGVWGQRGLSGWATSVFASACSAILCASPSHAFSRQPSPWQRLTWCCFSPVRAQKMALGRWELALGLQGALRCPLAVGAVGPIVLGLAVPGRGSRGMGNAGEMQLQHRGLFLQCC